MGFSVETENRAGLARVTCGWKLAALNIEAVRRYWRDVHSPAIARRAGLYEYRHFQFDPVRADLAPDIEGVNTACAADAQLMWTSDVRYCDQAGLEAFSASPPDDVRAKILADIDLIVDRSTTYLVVGQNGRTFRDVTGALPQGPCPFPTYSLFLRRRSDEAGFRDALSSISQAWAEADEVKRLRLALFETPDMEAERKAGYPVKTHPLEQQYQAWIDLTVTAEGDLAALMASVRDEIADQVKDLHVYPTRVVYTSNYDGRLTLVGLRGYPAHRALEALGANHQRSRELLDWMYGPLAEGVGA